MSVSECMWVSWVFLSVCECHDCIWLYGVYFSVIECRCMYAYVRVCENVWVKLCLWYVCKWMWKYVSEFECMWVYVSVCECMWMYVSVCECMWAYASVCEWIWVYLSVYEIIWVYMSVISVFECMYYVCEFECKCMYV